MGQRQSSTNPQPNYQSAESTNDLAVKMSCILEALYLVPFLSTNIALSSRGVQIGPLDLK